MVRNNRVITDEQHASIASHLKGIFTSIAKIIEIVGFDDKQVNFSLLGLEMCFNILREYLDSRYMAASDNYDVQLYYPKGEE
jgi:hypothetical protein